MLPEVCFPLPGLGLGNLKAAVRSRGLPHMFLLLSVVSAYTLIPALDGSFSGEPVNSESIGLKDLNCFSGAWYCSKLLGVGALKTTWIENF